MSKKLPPHNPPVTGWRSTSQPATVDAPALLSELRELIHSARQRVATVANAEQTMLYWRIGKRVAAENLIDGRAEYGKQILVTVSQQLEVEFGKGFGEKNVRRMVQFAEMFPDDVNCRITDTTIDLEPHHCLVALEQPFAAESTPKCAG